jgi:shikimate dehydrogenase
MDRYAVIGNPIAQSKSPLIHAAFAEQTGQAMSYERLLAPVDGFVREVEAFRQAGGRGLNVTTPFKLEAFALAVRRSGRAEAAGAVNTLAWQKGGWYGDNTDGVGLVRDIEVNLRFPLQGRDVLLLGAGGAARGVVGPLLAAKPRSLAIANRSHDKARELAQGFAAAGPVADLRRDEFDGKAFDLVIDATSATLSGNSDFLWPAIVARPGALAYELVYGKGETPFRHWAKACGAVRGADGLGMLVEQAAESFALWRGVRPDTAPVLAHMKSLFA